MTADSRRPRQAAANSEANEALVDLLVGHIDQAYLTAGQPGALQAVRDLFRRMSPADVKALVYQLGLAEEPPAEEPERR
jgi:hypothetical protein